MDEITPADGVEGCLIWCGGNHYMFRVYNPDYSFVDYELFHTDLNVVIKDKTASFYRGISVDRLDHSPETLGIKHERTN
jgi:hypothetical protein